MASYGTLRIETLNKDNFETWRIQMKALLVKNDSWIYVSGSKPKPALLDDDVNSKQECDNWIDMDEKAKADLILCISPSELKQIKNCGTSSDIWKKLEEIYQSKGPARKASLLKLLIQHKMSDSSTGVCIRDHLRKFFDIVDRLSEMDIKIDDDLLTVMLLYSLPSNFENFRCAIESRDELPKPEALRIKIVEESDARRHDERQSSDSGAFMANHFRKKQPWNNKNKKNSKHFDPKQKDNDFSKITCFKCKRVGHRSNQCGNYKPNYKQNDLGLLTSANNTTQALTISKEKMENLWCIDSGCTRHLCNNDSRFVNLTDTEIKTVSLANNGTTKVTGLGKALIEAEVNSQLQNLEVNDALLVPELKTNLLSVARICDRGYTVTFKEQCAVIKNSKDNVMLIADRKDNLYYLRGSDNSNYNANFASESIDSSKNKFADVNKWHCRMGHLNLKDLVDSNEKGNIRGLNVSKLSEELNCDVCALNKLTRAPFPNKSERVTKMLEVVHSDLCGPIRMPSIGKSLYFITFIDDYSRYCAVRFLKSKNEALEAFKEIKNLWENQKSTKIKIFHSDNGTEFLNREFGKFLKECGIEHRLTTPYSPEQAGCSERKNRTLVEMARCLLSQSKLPLNLWAEAVNTANYVRNRCPTKALNGKTPYELWNNVVPNVSYFKIFGCTAYCLNNRPSHKFSARSKKGIFVGYSENSKAFRVYFPSENKVITSRSVKFFEQYPSSPSKVGQLETDTCQQEINLDESKRGGGRNVYSRSD